MSDEHREMLRVIAARVLTDVRASPDRLAWARDALAWVDQGDAAAGLRIGVPP